MGHQKEELVSMTCYLESSLYSFVHSISTVCTFCAGGLQCIRRVVQLQMGYFCTLVMIRKLCNMILVTPMKNHITWRIWCRLLITNVKDLTLLGNQTILCLLLDMKMGLYKSCQLHISLSFTLCLHTRSWSSAWHGTLKALPQTLPTLHIETGLQLHQMRLILKCLICHVWLEVMKRHSQIIWNLLQIVLH